MKKLSYISLITLLTLGACTSSLYTGVEYDDVYFRASDEPVRKVAQDRQAYKGEFSQEQYYDNIYAADTLISDEYRDAVDYNNSTASENGYEYYDDYGYSYSNRLRRFHGNYFDPYWRDPFYFGFGYPFGYSFGYGYGWPYYDPYFGHGGFYDYYYPHYGYPYYGYGGYGYGYGYGFYSRYYGWGGYGGYYGGWPYYYSDKGSSVAYGRRERASTMSSRYNSNTGMTGLSRRDSYLSPGSGSSLSRRAASPTTTTTVPSQRRDYNSVAASRSAENLRTQDQSRETAGTRSATTPRTVTTKPEYNSADRSYTPSYNNPRMPSRPSYNNSRSAESSRTPSAQPSNQGTYSAPRRSEPSSPSSVPSDRTSNTYRSVAPSGSARPADTYRTPSYSAPARSSSSQGSGSYSGSSSRSYSGGSSYSSGSSSGSSSGGSSYSGGSSSSSGSSRSSSSGSSGSRR